MTFVENIFVLLAAPLLACLPFVRGRSRVMAISILCGMTCCLLSAYVNAFFIGRVGVGEVTGAVEVAPVVEETIKLLPILFYLLVLEPQVEDAELAIVAVSVSVGFATLESGLYLATGELSTPAILALRGLGTSMMHLTSGVLVGYGLTRVWTRPWLKVAGTAGLLCLAMTFHGLYNVLVAAGGAAQVVAVCLPAMTLASMLLVRLKRRG